MIIAIHQPQYLSWLGYFNKYLLTDMFILLDNVQFQRNGFQNRTRIKGDNGAQWLTVPVSYDFPSKIFDVKVNNLVNWQEKQWKTIVQNYRKANYFRKYSNEIESIFKSSFDNLVDLIVVSNDILLRLLKIDIPVVRASSLDVSGAKTDLLLSICRRVSADAYLSGIGGKEYMEEDKFVEAGIKVIYQNYKHPIYDQLHAEKPFEPNMSILDLLFNCGEKSCDIIRSGYQVNKGVIDNA